MIPSLAISLGLILICVEDLFDIRYIIPSAQDSKLIVTLLQSTILCLLVLHLSNHCLCYKLILSYILSNSFSCDDQLYFSRTAIIPFFPISSAIALLFLINSIAFFILSSSS